jgi:L-aminopeptidase/D-esterase-like protein
VNAVGDVVDEKMDVIAGARSASGRWKAADDPLRSFARTAQVDQTNTTLVVIMTDAKLSKIEATLVSERAHDGMARAIRPCHTSFDGDIAFALSSGETEAPMDSIAELGALLVADAIRSAVRSAFSVAGIPALGAS